MSDSISYRLEQYTIRHPQEVLIVRVDLGETTDEIIIFKGFSSSLVNPTAFDPDVPILPDDATIVAVDRLEGPYNSQNPRYIQQGLTWQDMQALLSQAGL